MKGQEQMEQYWELCDAIRAFNRFYTVKMDFLNASYLGGGYSIAETRVLFELQAHPSCAQSDIVKTLGIDKSYLSRIIQRFCAGGLVEKRRSEEDRRRTTLFLTGAGNAETNRLIALTDRQITGQIDGLSGEECVALTAALSTVTEILGKGGQEHENRTL